MKKALMTACLCGSMLAAAMPLSALAADTPNAVPERSRGVVAHMELPEFNAVYCDVVANITIEQGDEYLIEARGPEHLVLLIEPEVSKGTSTL